MPDICAAVDPEEKGSLRKSSLKLCFQKMETCDFPVWIIREFLEVCYPSDINELDPCPNQFVSFLDRFALYFGKMCYLCKLQLTCINSDGDIFSDTLADKEEKGGTKFLSQFSKLNHL